MIRPMTAADRPAVRSLQRHLSYADTKLIDAALRGPFRGYVAQDATIDDSVIGYAIAFPSEPLTVSELVVAASHRRSGYGRALIEHVASAADSTAVDVLTPADHTGAIRFYTRIGFERDRHIPDFYADGTDALRLVRRE